MLSGSKRKATSSESVVKNKIPRPRKDYTLQLAQIFDGMLQSQIQSLRQQNASLEAFMRRVSKNNKLRKQRGVKRQRLYDQQAQAQAGDEAEDQDEDAEGNGDGDITDDTLSVSSDHEGGGGGGDTEEADSDDEVLVTKTQQKQQKKQEKQQSTASTAKKTKKVKNAKSAGQAAGQAAAAAAALPRSAFHLFSSVRRQHHLQLRQNLPASERNTLATSQHVLRAIGEDWKALPEGERQAWAERLHDMRRSGAGALSSSSSSSSSSSRDRGGPPAVPRTDHFTVRPDSRQQGSGQGQGQGQGRAHDLDGTASPIIIL